MVSVMGSTRLAGLVASIVVGFAGFSALGACGTDELDPADFPDADPNAEGGLPDGYVPPVRAEFGLETRPSNTTCLAQTRPPSTAPVKFEQVFANVDLQAPMMIAQIPGDKTRWFVAQRGGTIVSFPATAPPTNPTAVGSVPAVSGKTIQTSGEGGLLGLAFHPKFAQNGKLYVTWTTTGGASPVDMMSTSRRAPQPRQRRLVRRVQGDPRAVSAAVHEPRRRRHRVRQGRLPLLLRSATVARVTTRPFTARARPRCFSKVLRIDVDNVRRAASPTASRRETRSRRAAASRRRSRMGFRNPFRISIDRETERGLGRRRRPERVGGDRREGEGRRQLRLAVPRGPPRLAQRHQSREVPARPDDARPHRSGRRAPARDAEHALDHRRRRLSRRGDPGLRRHVRVRRLRAPGAVDARRSTPAPAPPCRRSSRTRRRPTG